MLDVGGSSPPISIAFYIGATGDLNRSAVPRKGGVNIVYEAFEGLRRMDAPKGTKAGWKEQTGCFAIYGDDWKPSPPISMFTTSAHMNVVRHRKHSR